MRRFIAHLLIFSVLVTNVAWAMDDCFSQNLNEASGLVQPADIQNDEVCDDLCVGWLHLVAINPDTKLGYFPFSRQEAVRTGIFFHSLDQAPPLRPPQI